MRCLHSPSLRRLVTKKVLKGHLLVVLAGLLPEQGCAAPPAFEFSSGTAKVALLELYTSEGCSSCPAADQFVSQYVGRRELWDRAIPVAFHVDYWDELGWVDPLARAAFSERQRAYQRIGYANAVYTPGFFLNGREWRGFFGSPRQLPDPFTDTEKPGVLSIRLEHQNGPGDTITVFFEGRETTAALVAHVAGLGFDIKHQIRRGENAGRTLTHDFVVLSHQTRRAVRSADGYTFTIEGLGQLQSAEGRNLHIQGATQASAIVAWVTALRDPTPLQATGGWLR